MKPNPKNHLARSILATLAVPFALLLTVSDLQAQSFYRGVADDWATGSNWSGGVSPTGAFNQRLNFNGGTAVTFGDAQGTVDIGTTSARAFTIGLINTQAAPDNTTGTATLNITGGILRANSTTSAVSLVGVNATNSTGILNVSGGTLDLTTATGDGRVLAVGLRTGTNAGISGTVSISGTGTVKASEFRFNESNTNPGGISGILNLNSGGTLETAAIREGASGADQAAVTSTVNLNGGLLKLTGAAPSISGSLTSLNVLSGGANIEVVEPAGLALANENFLDGTGGGGLTKSGPGSLTLPDASTYTGDTAISAGTLSAAKIDVSGGSSSLGNATNAVTLGSAGSQGTLSYSGANATYTRGLAIGGAGGGRLDVTNSASTLAVDTGAVTGTGLFTVGGAGDTTINSAVTHTGGVTKGPFVTATSALTLANGTNSYDGVTTITHGAIVVTANGALGATTAGTVITAGLQASLALDSVDYAAAETLTGSGPGSGTVTGVLPDVQRGFIQSKSGGSIFRGNIILNANGVSRIGTQNGASLTLTGPITQADGVTTASILFRAGNGPLLPTPNTGGDFVTLSNAGNSFGGDSQIFTGAATGYSGVRLGVANGLPMDLTISGFTGTAAGTALDLNGFNQSLDGLTGANVLNIINTDTDTTSTLTLSPTADQSTAGTVILGGTGLTGTLGTIHLVKDGAFTQTLAGVNTYTGTTTVSAGRLLVNSPGSLAATSAVAVNGASTLGGSGSIGGNVTVAAAAKLAPGASAAGTLTLTGNLDISALAGGAGQLEFELGALAGTNDQIAVGGSLALGALALDDLAVTNLGGLLQAGTYTLITSTGLSGSVDGSTALIAPGFNGKLQTNGNNLELVVTTVGGSAYDLWADANAPITGNDPAADEDDDGVSNGVEFVLGGTIGTNDLGKLPEIATDGTNMTFTFERDQDSIDPGNTTVTIEVSTDLAIWNTAPSPYTVPDGATGVVNPGVTVVKGVLPADPDTITLTVPQTGARKFARLKVDITTP